MLVLLGSHALKYHTKIDREPKDLDVLGDYDEIIKEFKPGKPRACYPINGGKKIVIKSDIQIVEGEITWPGSTAQELYSLILAQNPIKQTGILIPALDILYLLKMSHRFLKNSPHFLKTMRDIQLMRSLGAMVTPKLQGFYGRRVKETYDYGHPKLRQSKVGFFSGDGVKYVYDHDSIHEAVAIGREPAYRKYQKEGEEVACDKTKWDALTEREKLAGVLEECYVLALERSQIPFPDRLTPIQSFDMALSKVCTSITSGWFREYAWENYDKVREMMSPFYVQDFQKKVEKGLVSKVLTS